MMILTTRRKGMALNLRTNISLIVYFILLQGFHCVIDVHFENKEGGFFLKQSSASNRQQQKQWLTDSKSLPSNEDDNSVLSTTRFTIFHNSHPISVRAVYGPFSTKQTVPARYIVPDSPVPPPSSVLTVVVNSSTAENAKANPLFDGRHLEVSAHLVNREIARDSPVLRVLFHMAGVDRTVRKFSKQQSVCVVLHISFGEESPLITTCVPSLDDGQCLAEVTIPSTWWPPLPTFEPTKPQKSPRRTVQASYYVREPKIELQTDETESHWIENCSPHSQIQPLTKIDSVPLVNALSGYRELKIDDVLFTLVPMAAVYPLSKIYVPVYIRSRPKNNVVGFIIKARAKNGIKIMDAPCRKCDLWDLSFTSNPKNIAATVTVMLKKVSFHDYNQTSDFQSISSSSKVDDEQIDEVFSWLMEVEHDLPSDVRNEEAHVVWNVYYVVANKQEEDPYLVKYADSSESPINDRIATKSHSSKRMDKTKHKISARFELHKDITQAVLPVSKTWELINTALLTGKQVSQPMKIFVVSQSGKIADVTRQSTCHTEDDSVLKVTSSCSSVYVDGSETRGSSNATILVKYETFTGTASFTVWMPELAELDIVISDTKLSQIYDWAVPDPTVDRAIKRSFKSVEQKRSSSKSTRNMKPTYLDYTEENSKSLDPMCKLKYQQATVDVYCRFKAVDHDTGRVTYLINRKTWLKITDLVMRGLRVADSQIATLDGRILTGRNAGRTEVQIISLLSGRVVAYKEVRVVNDKVSITKLSVNVVSGLQLNIVPDSSGENIYIAETSITRKLSAQYQEGLLDIEVEFSDGSITSVSDINVADYMIAVDSISPEIVAFAPMVTSLHPRVIAVGEGRGNLLKVSLLLPDSCRTHTRLKEYVLVSASAFVNVIFYDNEYGQKSPMFVQNDGGMVNNFLSSNNKADGKYKDTDEPADFQEILNGIEPSNEAIKEAAKQTQSNRNHYSTVHRRASSHISPMEMGMYIIVATFSFAIIVFVVSCIVFATRYKPQNIVYQGNCSDTPYLSNGYKLLSNPSAPTKRAPPTTNVHDWVWLGRATIERASGLLKPSLSTNDKFRRKNDNWIRITSNPTYTPEPSPDTILIGVDESNLGDRKNRSRIDSTTYNKHNPKELPRRNNRQKCFRLPNIPDRSESLNVNEAYKPPVPPHKNLDLGKSHHITDEAVPNDPSLSAVRTDDTQLDPDLPQKRKHHHHHHRHHHHHHRRNGSTDSKNNYLDLRDVYEEEAASVTNGKKRSTEKKGEKFTETGEESTSKRNRICNSKPLVDDDTLGIEDLSLAMDYQQIMEYFNNLKESTA